MANNQTLQAILTGQTESRAREYKQSLSWNDTSTRGKVVKWALGAANLRDGGALAFGMERHGAIYAPVGMTKEHHDSFDQDAVSSTVNKHAEPRIELSVNHVEIEGNLFVVIMVRQFVDYPVICVRDFVDGSRPIVVRGRVYCRSRRTPETTEIQSAEDMREIIELGIDRGLERYFRQREIEARLSGRPAEEQFRRQIADLLE